MVRVCYLCKKGEIVHDKKMSGMFCTGCGECFELGAFTDEVQYREDDRGRYTAVGTTYNVEKGFVNSKFSNHAQFLTSVDNARSILKRYCDKLYISESFAQISSSFYQKLLIKKFMNGRRLNVVLAACLYISVRSEGANVILLDISDVSEANVYDIGRYYFQIVRILNFNITTVDPSEYTIRFVDMLELGDRKLAQVKRTAINIRDTANRLVQRMKRDWIHFGRRPSGVCAAAVLVAARINNVHCNIRDIINIAKVCESTIRKRINEFIETPSSKLTYQEFMSQEVEGSKEEDPPSYKVSIQIKKAVEENLEEVERVKGEIEERLKESRVKLGGVYAKFLKEIFTAQTEEMEEKVRLEADDESQIIEETIIDQNILAVDQKIAAKLRNEMKQQGNDSGNPSAEEIAYWAEFRPSAKSLGLLKKEEPSNVEKVDYNDLLNEKLDDIDDEDIDFYIIQDQEEVKQRQLEWNLVNKDYIKLMDEKESQKLNDDSKPGTAPKGRKKRRKGDDSDKVEANTTSEAVEAACKAKSISLNGINLKELFNEDDTTSSSKSSDKPATASSVEAATASTSANIPPDAQLDEAMASQPLSNGNKKSQAKIVNLYHSYAIKSSAETDDSITLDEIISKDQPNDEPIGVNDLDKSDSLKAVISSPHSSSSGVHSIPSSSKRKMDEAGEPEDMDDDDYFHDDDDEDDELAKIKKKYLADQESEFQIGQESDYEDCGF